MGAVRSFTPDGTVDGDDVIVDVALPFTFWGYERATVGNNGTLSFHPNYILDADSNGWDDLGWEYCWTEPLASGAPGTDWIDESYGKPWFRPVGIFPLCTDIEGSDYATEGGDYYGLQSVTYGFDTIGGKQAFLVTWKDITLYDLNQGEDTPVDIPRNTFQVVIFEDDTFEVNYDKVEWTTPYSWTSITAPAYGTTVDSDMYIHALGGYRMVTESEQRTLEITYSGGTGTLSVGDDILEHRDANNRYIWTVVSIDGDSVAGTATCLMNGAESASTAYPYEGVPLGFMFQDDTYPTYQIAGSAADAPPQNTLTTAEGWSASLVSELWHNNDPAYETVYEFPWSRAVTFRDQTDYDILDEQLDTYTDGGSDPLILQGNTSEPGRFTSTSPFDFVPSITVDVGLSGSLSLTGPASAGGLLELVVDMNVYVFSFAEGQVDIIASPEGGLAWLGSADMASTLTVDVGLAASDYREYVTDMNGYDSGGNWDTARWYSNTYGSWGAQPVRYYGAVIDGKTGGRWVWPAQTNGENLSYSRSRYVINSADFPYWLGFDTTLTVWVYVPSPSPMVSLQASTESYMDYPWQQYGDRPTVLDEVSTTNHNTWQQLSVTIPAAEMRKYPLPLFRIMHDQMAGADYYLAEPVITFSGNATGTFAIDAFDHAATEHNSFPYHPDIGVSGDYRRATDTTANGDQAWEYEIVRSSPRSRRISFSSIESAGPGASYRGVTLSETPHYFSTPDLFDVKVSVWVYVPSGYSPVKLTWMLMLHKDYPSAYVYALEKDRGVVTTTHDEWEKLEITVPYWLWAYGIIGGVPSSYYPQTNRASLTPVNQELTTLFYFDDVGYEIVPREGAFTMAIYSVDEERGMVTSDVSLEATLWDGMLYPESAIDVDVDLLYGFQPVEGAFDVPVTTGADLSGGYNLVTGQSAVLMDMSGSLHMTVTLNGLLNSWNYNAYRPPPSLNQVSPTSTDDTVVYRSAPNSRKFVWAAQNGSNATWLDPAAWAYDSGGGIVPMQTFPVGYDLTMTIWVRVTSGGPIKLQSVDTHTTFPHGTFWESEPTILDEVATTSTGTWEQLTLTIPASKTVVWPLASFRIYHTQTGAEYHLDDFTYTVSGVRTAHMATDGFEYDEFGNQTNMASGSFRLGPLHPSNPTYGASLWYGNEENPLTGSRGFRLEIYTPEPDLTRPGWALYPFRYSMVYHMEDNWPMTVGVWVWVEPGSPPLTLRVANRIYDGLDTSRTFDFDIVAPVTTTTTGQWEYLEASITNTQRAWYQSAAAATVLWGGSGSVGTTNGLFVLTPEDPNGLGTYYLDDMSVGQYKIASPVPATVGIMAKGYSYVPNVDCVANVVDMQATVTLLPPLAGSVDVDIDMFKWDPYDEPISGSLDIAVVPAKGYRMLVTEWDIPENPAWEPSWSAWTTPGFEGPRNTGEYDADDWDSDYWAIDGEYPTLSEWYAAYPWSVVRSGSRSMKARFPVIPDWPGYFTMALDAGQQSLVCYTRFEVWVYVEPGSGPVALRALPYWNSATSSQEPYDIADSVYNTPEVRSTTTGQWEKLALVIDPLLPGNQPPPGTTPPWNGRWYIDFEVYPVNQDDVNQIFYVDDYEVFWDRVGDSRIIYLEAR